jgi:tetratricopeptide (TPR) repeat protein
MQNDFDRELQNYFTDVEHLREMFKQWLAAPALPKRLLIVHGVGGVGKSSLLRMFRLHCKSVGVPVALASGDEQKSALEVLTRWADDLKADGVRLPEFDKTFQQYRAIQAKVENEATKLAGKLAKSAAATVVETVASTIPGIGPLLGKLGGMGAEALVDWLRGFLTRPDIDLLLDPAKKLTADFLADLQKAADRRRIVLMLDTFEQMTALEDWAREVAQQLPVNVLLVIAGRALPNWDRAWAGWMANAQVEELRPMSEDDMRELVRRYYATLRGGEPDPKQVEAIIRFARGLPMVVTSAVQLWVKYGVEDFQAVKPEIVANLVDRLMEGVPKGMVPALEAAAIVRWFDQPILRAVMAQEDVRDAYNELRRFPFVRTRAEGLALHDAVREIVDENLRVQDAERHRELHERAAAYFEKQMADLEEENKKWISEWRSALLERIWQMFMVNEQRGMALLLPMIEETLRLFQFDLCGSLLSQAEEANLVVPKHRDWLRFYRTLLAQMQGKLTVKECTVRYTNLLGTDDALLRCFVSYHLGELALGIGDYSEAERWYDSALEIWRSLNLPHTTFSTRLMRQRAYIFRKRGMFDRALAEYKRAERVCKQIGDLHGIAHLYQMFGGLHRDKGEYKEALRYYQRALKLLDQIGGDVIGTTRAGLLNTTAHVHLLRGDWDSAIESAQRALSLARQQHNEHERNASISKLISAHLHKQDWQVLGDYIKEYEQIAILTGNPGIWAETELVKGHASWDGNIPEYGSGFDAALRYYQHALIYALRYNRFLLDEVLSGRPQGTPLRPIIPECLKRGEEGRRMLIALRDWWQTGTNDIGTPRPDTISPIPEGIPLLEAERIARERESGDGSPQKSVVEQIEAALKNVEAG